MRGIQEQRGAKMGQFIGVTDRFDEALAHMMRCAIWYHFYNSKNVKSTNGGVLLLASAYNFTENNTPPWVFSRF